MPRQAKGAQCLARLRDTAWVLINMRCSAFSDIFSNVGSPTFYAEIPEG
jgi:hypothetical protein